MTAPQGDTPSLPDKGHCACKFSSGGVLSKSCEFHTRLLAAKEREIAELRRKRDEAVRKEREACAKEAESVWIGATSLGAYKAAGKIMRAIRARSEGGK